MNKTAVVIRVHPNGFAFLAYEGELDGDELYLHRRQVQDLPSCTFESLLGVRVSISEVVMTPKGPAAMNCVVLPADEQSKRDHGFIEVMGDSYGFLIPDVGGRLFCHRAELAAVDWPDDLVNCRVTFTMAMGKRGLKAVALRPEDDRAQVS